MSVSLPVVEPLQRALHLRSIDLFADLGAHDLAVCAALLREQWLRRGDVLHTAGKRIPALFLLVEGTVRLEREGKVQRIVPPEGVGLVELLAQVESPTRAVADGNALALVIDAPTFLEVLEDHFSIVLHLRSVLGRRVRELAAKNASLDVSPPTPLPVHAPPSLDLVGQLLRLHRVPALHRFGAGVLAALVRDHGEMRLAPGEALWAEDDEASFFALVVEGTVLCRGGGGEEVRAERGCLLGLDAAFGGSPHLYGAIADKDVVAIRIGVTELLDAAEDHFHVATEILAHCARRLLSLNLA